MKFINDKYEVNVFFKRKRSYVGIYQNEDDAARAYNLKSIELKGTTPNDVSTEGYRLNNDRLEKLEENKWIKQK